MKNNETTRTLYWLCIPGGLPESSPYMCVCPFRHFMTRTAIPTIQQRKKRRPAPGMVVFRNSFCLPPRRLALIASASQLGWRQPAELNSHGTDFPRTMYRTDERIVNITFSASKCLISGNISSEMLRSVNHIKCCLKRIDVKGMKSIFN